MDTITHIALGAVLGEAYAGKKIGKRAMLYGALTQSLPDIDFIASFWLDPADNLLAHRGITHSIFFASIVTVMLGLLIYRWHKPRDLSLKSWMLFFGLEIFTHLFVDAFNNYGVAWFEPFDHYRISFNTIFVADPFFAIGLIIAFVVLLFLKEKSTKRILWARLGLLLSSLYLIYGVINKTIISKSVIDNLVTQKISYNRFFTAPTALNNWLWYIVVEEDSGYHIAYRSVFDKTKNIQFSYYKRQESLLKSIQNQHDLKQLLKFSQGYYTIENWGDTLVFNDLRFGQIMGWADPNAKFVFHYYLKHSEQNLLVVQRGRFSGWNRKSLEGLIKRIGGN